MTPLDAVRVATIGADVNNKPFVICTNSTGELVAKPQSQVTRLDVVLEVCRPMRGDRYEKRSS